MTEQIKKRATERLQLERPSQDISQVEWFHFTIRGESEIITVEGELDGAPVEVQL
jgi:hypothetical protein